MQKNSILIWKVHQHFWNTTRLLCIVFSREAICYYLFVAFVLVLQEKEWLNRYCYVIRCKFLYFAKLYLITGVRWGLFDIALLDSDRGTSRGSLSTIFRTHVFSYFLQVVCLHSFWLIGVVVLLEDKLVLNQTFVFQQINPKYSSKLCKSSWRKRRRRERGPEWQFQDVNIKELVRKELDRRVRQNYQASDPYLWLILQKTWQDFYSEYFHSWPAGFPGCAVLWSLPG